MFFMSPKTVHSDSQSSILTPQTRQADLILINKGFHKLCLPKNKKKLGTPPTHTHHTHMYSLQYGAPFQSARVNFHLRQTQTSFQSLLNGNRPLQRYDHVSMTLLMGIIASLHCQISLLNINLSRYLLICREQMLLLLNTCSLLMQYIILHFIS